MHQGGGGKMSVRSSVFYNNSAGSGNVQDGKKDVTAANMGTKPLPMVAELAGTDRESV